MKIHGHCFQRLAVATFTPIVFYANSVSAQIVPDATLPSSSRVTQQGNINIIEGGTQVGSNLFHSFEQFSVPTNTTASFNNTINIQNIITRITGKSISNIDGILRANGTANLFLINPNGIIFGENASLNIGGSFLASTASSINFADGTKFSSTQPQTAALLTINIPIGLQFGATSAPIYNQSQSFADDANNFDNPGGLQVPTGKTLALIGGDVILAGGNLIAKSGRVELGSVGGNSLVSLNTINKSWFLGYEGVENFQNIQIIQHSVNGSEIPSNVDVSGKESSGSIQIKGNIVELIGSVNLLSINQGFADSGDLNITARELVIRDGAQINIFTFNNSAGGNLTVNASESVKIIGGFTTPSGDYFPSGLSSATVAPGKAGNITINTSRLLIQGGGAISVESSGRGFNSQFFLPATGKAGNLTVNASDSVELIGSSSNSPSSLSATTVGSANGGKITISTKRLIVKDGAEISVNSQIPSLAPNLTFLGDASDLGNAGDINITADSILLENQGKLASETSSGRGGNITLQLQDLLLLRRNSQISTNAGKAELEGDGGNITINIADGFIVAIPNENSDITANAFTGNGGRVEINATGIFGINPRSRDDLAQVLSTNNPSELNPQSLLTSDITAISQISPTLTGEVNINTLDVEPTRELMQLPNIPLDTKISQVCKLGRNGNQSEFIFTRRGGLPPLPSEAQRSDSPLDVDWVSLEEDGGSGETEGSRISTENQIIPNPQLNHPKSQVQNRIVEATRWIVDENGDTFLVAAKPTTRLDNPKGVGVSRSILKSGVGCNATTTSHQPQNRRNEGYPTTLN
jgi:filamentous hemagglutinin family protein